MAVLYLSNLCDNILSLNILKKLLARYQLTSPLHFLLVRDHIMFSVVHFVRIVINSGEKLGVNLRMGPWLSHSIIALTEGEIAVCVKCEGMLVHVCLGEGACWIMILKWRYCRNDFVMIFIYYDKAMDIDENTTNRGFCMVWQLKYW